MASITVQSARPSVTRGKGFLDMEVRTILSASLEPVPAALRSKRAAARRWIPWLATYSGARIGELAQLRSEDVRQSDGTWILHLAQQRGRRRTHESRIVALHPHLIEQGFPAFVNESGGGPLFYDPELTGSDNTAEISRIGERLSRWTRQIGIGDPNVSPSRAWRYRFIEVARRLELDPAVLTYLMSSRSHDERNNFVHFSPDAIFREIVKLPRIEVS